MSLVYSWLTASVVSDNTMPVTSSMQRHLNTVGDKIQDLNETDMYTFENGGYLCDTPMPAKWGQQYNNNLHNGRRHCDHTTGPGYAVSRWVLAENLAADKKTIQWRKQTL